MENRWKVLKKINTRRSLGADDPAELKDKPPLNFAIVTVGAVDADDVRYEELEYHKIVQFSNSLFLREIIGVSKDDK